MRTEILLIIGGMALVTYFTRVGSLVILRYSGIPAYAKAWLKHIPTAILTALIVPARFLPRGYLDISLHNHYLLAGAVAGVTAYKSRNIVLSLIVGFVLLFVLKKTGL